LSRALIAAIAAVVVAGLGVLIGFALGHSGTTHIVSNASGQGITVNGTATVSSVPNQADFTLGVSSDADTSAAASAANAAAMTKVLNVLKARGIAPADIQTADVSVSQRYAPNGSKVVGYTASNTVTVRVHKIPQAGAILDAAVNAGANQISGPTLSSSNAQDLSRVALTAAMADAQKRAQAIAAAGNLTLGDIVSASESSSSPPIVFAEGKAAVPSASTPIVPGKIQTEADVTVVYAIG
jgi:uncharacterized protein